MISVRDRWFERFVDARWWLLAVACLLVGAAWQPAASVRYDRTVENMFAPGDPLLDPYKRLKRTFGGNEIVLAVYEDPDLWAADGAGLQRLESISTRCEAVEGVRAVLSLDRLMGTKILDPDSSVAQRTRDLFENYTHGNDGRTAAVVCMLETSDDSETDRMEVIDRLQQIMADLPDGLRPGTLAGEPVLVAEGFRCVEEDGRRLGIWSTALLAVVILVAFRSIRWVVIPLLVVQAALLWTKASLVWGQLRLSMVSSMLTAVITVIGVATMVHVIVRYRQLREAGSDSRKAMIRAASWLAAPITWACLTDAVGFASLETARVGPIQDFGLMMAVGSLFVLLAVPMLVPALALAGRWDAGPRTVWGEGRMGRLLELVLSLPRRHGAWVLVGTFVVLATALAGVARLQVETDFTKNFRANSPIIQSYQLVESRLGGAGVMDVLVPAPSTLDWAYLQRIKQLEQRLRTEVTLEGDGETPALTKVLSLADAVDAMAPMKLSTVRLTAIRNALVRTSVKAMRTRLPAFVDALYGSDPLEEDQFYFRIMLRAREQQSAVSKRRVIEEVKRIAGEEFPGTEKEPRAEVTGYYVLLTRLIESIVRDQWTTFAVATAAIWLMMLAAFRSWRLSLVALVPNAIPVLVVLGALGWLAIPMNMGAAMIAAVSIGLSIDSSVHYITAYRRARLEGHTPDESAARVQQTVGRAASFSTVALIVGFASLWTSPFIPTVYFGVLVSLSMLGGLVGNLVVLPALLLAVDRR